MGIACPAAFEPICMLTSVLLEEITVTCPFDDWTHCGPNLFRPPMDKYEKSVFIQDCCIKTPVIHFQQLLKLLNLTQLTKLFDALFRTTAINVQKSAFSQKLLDPRYWILLPACISSSPSLFPVFPPNFAHDWHHGTTVRSKGREIFKELLSF